MSIAMLVTMCLGFALSISIAVSIGLAALLGTWLSNVNMLLTVKEIYTAINKFPLAAIPFFILAGNIMESGGISRFPPTNTRPSRTSTSQVATGFSAGAATASPVRNEKHAWCHGQRTVSPTTNPSASGPP